MTVRFVFRVDASLTIGSGHVMRCLALAEELRACGAECQFISRDLPGNLGFQIKARGHSLILLEPPAIPMPSNSIDHADWLGVSWKKDLEDTRATFDEADWLVVDHYALDVRWESGFKGVVKNIMVIDDLADRPHFASLLLDQNLGRKRSHYNQLVPSKCCCLVGTNFAILRPEFAARRVISLTRRANAETLHLMISMGGMDLIDATSSVLLAIAQTNLPANLRISVVLGGQAPAIESVCSLAQEMPWPTNVLVDVSDMAALMEDADIAVGAGGSTCWERCCMGLPTVVVETATNQTNAINALCAMGATLGVGSIVSDGFATRLTGAIDKLLLSENRKRLTVNSSKLCDGNGVSRIVKKIRKISWK